MGSSLMPQKRNPEPAELVRGRAGRIVGDLMTLFVVLKGLPLAYDSDLQEDKDAVFDAVDTARACLEASRRISAGLIFHPDRMAAALDGGHATATDLADYLVRKGIPFRAAHEQAGRAVREAERRNARLADLPLDVLRLACPTADEDYRAFLSPESSVRARRSDGGPSPDAVARQLEVASKEAAAGREWLAERRPPPIYRAHLKGRLLSGEIE
jgi:argininosuccinate lyase